MRWRILLVDGDATTRKAVEDILGVALPDAVFESVHSPHAALAAVQRQRPDLVVADERLHPMDASQLASEMHRNHPRLPILVLSSDAEATRRKVAKATNVCAVLDKPLDGRRLVAVAQTCLRGGAGLPTA